MPDGILLIKLFSPQEVKYSLCIAHTLCSMSAYYYGLLIGESLHKTSLIEAYCCCCLPTPVTLASGGNPMFPLVVHQASSTVTLAGSVHKSRGDNVVCMWVQLKR